METALDPWLEARLRDVPEELAEAVRGLARSAPRADAEGFVSAALDAFESVASGTGGRSNALELLAADALLTYAFEASAEPALGGSAARAVGLAVRTGPSGEIGRRLASIGRPAT